jgi:hypothetical protein
MEAAMPKKELKSMPLRAPVEAPVSVPTEARPPKPTKKSIHERRPPPVLPDGDLVPDPAPSPAVRFGKDNETKRKDEL